MKKVYNISFEAAIDYINHNRRVMKDVKGGQVVTKGYRNAMYLNKYMQSGKLPYVLRGDKFFFNEKDLKKFTRWLDKKESKKNYKVLKTILIILLYVVGLLAIPYLNAIYLNLYISACVFGLIFLIIKLTKKKEREDYHD